MYYVAHDSSRLKQAINLKEVTDVTTEASPGLQMSKGERPEVKLC